VVPLAKPEENLLDDLGGIGLSLAAIDAVVNSYLHPTVAAA
jgi:hypothetical protein